MGVGFTLTFKALITQLRLDRMCKFLFLLLINSFKVPFAFAWPVRVWQAQLFVGTLLISPSRPLASPTNRIETCIQKRCKLIAIGLQHVPAYIEADVFFLSSWAYLRGSIPRLRPAFAATARTPLAVLAPHWVLFAVVLLLANYPWLSWRCLSAYSFACVTREYFPKIWNA